MNFREAQGFQRAVRGGDRVRLGLSRGMPKDELGALVPEVTKEKRMGGMKEQVWTSRSVSDGSLAWRRSFTHAVRRDPQGNCIGPQMCFTSL